MTSSILMVTEGNRATFTMTEYDETHSPSYEWFYDSVSISDSTEKYSGQFTASLTIMDVQKDDAGDYTCQVSVEGTIGGATAEVIVCEWKLYICILVILLIFIR